MGDNAEILYRSSAQTNPQAVSDVRKFFPIPQIEDLAYGLEQDFEQLSSNFIPPLLNSPHPTDGTCFLQSVSGGSDKGAYITQWTGKYYQVPPGWDDWENVSYTFPSFPGYLQLPSGVLNPIGRGPYTPPNGVVCRVHHDYFMVGPGRTYTDASKIPIVPVQSYVGKLNSTFFNDPPMVVPVGNITVGSSEFLESVPNQGVYQGWVTNAAAQQWAAGYDNGSGLWQVPGQAGVVLPGQIVISCKLQRVMGNLWDRVTRYVLPQ